MGVRRIADATALVMPGLHKWLWEKRIREFENDPRLVRSVMGCTANELEATRRQWLQAKRQQCKRLGIDSPRERFEAGEPFTFGRWMLGGHTWHIEHPLVADRSVRWLKVDCDDVVTVGEARAA